MPPRSWEEKQHEEAMRLVKGATKPVAHVAIPFGAGRPERGTIISTDEIINLRIAIETIESLDEFLATV